MYPLAHNLQPTTPLPSSPLGTKMSDFLEYMEIEKGSSPLTLRNYKHYLDRFYIWMVESKNELTPEAIDSEIIRQYRVTLSRMENGKGERLSRKTQGYHAIALRSFLKWLIKNDVKVLSPDKIDLPKITERQVKAGGNANPELNSRLRFAIDQAKADNMPKTNIDRLLARASESGNIDEMVYEGFGPAGTMVIVEAATDNRNRTAQEMKNLFEKSGGNMGGPGSVSFNFDPKGLLILKKEANSEEQILRLIDAGADDIVEADDALEVYVAPDKLAEMKKVLEEAGFTVTSFELTRQPKTPQLIEDLQVAQKILNFLDALENHDDVQKVYANIEIPENVLSQLTS